MSLNFSLEELEASSQTYMKMVELSRQLHQAMVNGYTRAHVRFTPSVPEIFIIIK